MSVVYIVSFEHSSDESQNVEEAYEDGFDALKRGAELAKEHCWEDEVRDIPVEIVEDYRTVITAFQEECDSGCWHRLSVYKLDVKKTKRSEVFHW